LNWEGRPGIADSARSTRAEPLSFRAIKGLAGPKKTIITSERRQTGWRSHQSDTSYTEYC